VNGITGLSSKSINRHRLIVRMMAADVRDARAYQVA